MNEQESNISKELVEEIANALRLYLPPSEKAPPDQYERVARGVIVIIGNHFLSAVHRGDLDEALGVAGRTSLAKMDGDCNLLHLWLDQRLKSGQTEFIALRQEEATDEGE